jgi:hypothetical protein
VTINPAFRLPAILALLLSTACTGSDAAPPTAGAGAGGSAGSGAGAGGSSGSTAGASAGGSPGAVALAACKTFCAAEEDCNADTTLAECEDTECVNPVNASQSITDSPPDCQEAMGAYWTCLSQASDPCNRDSCPGNSDAVVSACF